MIKTIITYYSKTITNALYSKHSHSMIRVYVSILTK